MGSQYPPGCAPTFGEQPSGNRLIKLNTNENPYPPAPGVERALREMDPEAFRKYPDPSSSCLVEALAAHCRVEKGGFSWEWAPTMCWEWRFLTFFNSKKAGPCSRTSVTPSIRCGRICSGFPTRRRLWIQVEDPDGGLCMGNGGVVFPSPNAPTGRFMSLDQVEEIVSKIRTQW